MDGGKPEAASGVVIVMAVVMEASAILAPEGGGYDGLRRRGRWRCRLRRSGRDDQVTSQHPPPPDDGTGKIPGVQGRRRGRRGGGGRSVEKGVGERQGERQGGGCGGGQPRPERAWRTISHVRRGVRWISWEGGRNGPRRPRRWRSSSVCRHSFVSRFRFSIPFRKPRESRRIRRTKYQVLVVTCFDLHSGHTEEKIQARPRGPGSDPPQHHAFAGGAPNHQNPPPPRSLVAIPRQVRGKRTTQRHRSCPQEMLCSPFRGMHGGRLGMACLYDDSSSALKMDTD